VSARHVYLHVPFCARKCSYCDFAIAVRRTTPDAEYLEAITREWDTRRRQPAPAPAEPLRTIYLGGGTPSRLAPATIGSLIGLLTRDRDLAPGAEVTLEANPDDVTPERAVAWARAGVNRISLGVQSHDPAVLQWMHRTHRAEQVAPAMAMLRGAGIRNVSVDLIFALPPEVSRDWRADVTATLALEPDHVSLYGLTVEPHTPLARWALRGAVHEAPEERYADEYLLAHDALSRAGFNHYEVSNAGRPGKEAQHNRAYWTGADYVGLGPSAHSLREGVRSWNAREWVAYRDRVAASGLADAGSEELTPEQRLLERRYLDLRTTAGTPREGLDGAVVAAWEREGWATIAEGRVVLTPQGWLRLDALVTQVGLP
jgi:oxygen-independent coproporphyrinogen-3 oxidase